MQDKVAVSEVSIVHLFEQIRFASPLRSSLNHNIETYAKNAICGTSGWRVVDQHSSCVVHVFCVNL